jgi:hypothetical protein
MSEEELDAAGALAADEDQDELLEELSLDERKERLTKARWNVFLYLGVAAILFFFALFPMPFDAQMDDFSSSAEKDIGFVWGMPLDGEDFFDVPMRLTVTATSPPTQPNINIAVYVIQQEDCTDFTLSEKMEEAKAGESHDYQYQNVSERVLADGSYEMEFDIDPGQYCLIAEYIDSEGEKIIETCNPPADPCMMDLEVEGKLYPNQFFGGIAGLVCLTLSGFAFVGAQRHGASMRALLEGENESTETKVLSEASMARISAGPGGPPQAGPEGPPPAAGPAGPPETEPSGSETSDGGDAMEGTFEPAENGYFFRKLPDGTYDQTVFVQNEDGSYAPHQG